MCSLRELCSLFSLSIVILLFVLLFFITSSSSIFMHGNQQIATASSSEEEDNGLETFQKGFCGLNAKPNHAEYITEYVLPQTCEMPLGIAVDIEENKVWYVSTNKGLLGSYDIEERKFDQEQQIPEWSSRENLRKFSQVWDIDIDNRKEGGDIWFTDEKQNAIWRYIKSSNTFEMYIVPGKSEDFETTYPISMKFDPNDDNLIYFVGMFMPSLWIAEIDKLENGTSKGINEIPIPTDGFQGIDPVYIATGSVAFDQGKDKEEDDDDAVWISMMAYGYKGQLFRYDLDTKSFDVFDLPAELNSPWGLTIDDDNGNLWVTNAGTSIFYRFDPIIEEDREEEETAMDDNNVDDDIENVEIEKFVTSKASPRIFGKLPENSSERDFQNRYYTLPSLIEKSDDGSVWFNEQHGNKISKFDPSTRTLIEYWVPTQNRLWGSCSNDDDNSSNYNNNNNDTCGIANVLQFSTLQNDNNDREDEQIWFTEWSENKIGRLEVIEEEDLPFSIDVFESDEELIMERGEKEKIKLTVKAASESPLSSTVNNLRLIASGTFTSSGDLGNSTGYFDESSSISMDEGEEQEVSFEFIPSADLKPGDYILMIGAENDSISYLKAVKIKIV
jgi:virginiamycin B lyase